MILRREQIELLDHHIGDAPGIRAGERQRETDKIHTAEYLRQHIICDFHPESRE